VLLNCSKATIRKRWLAIYDKVPEHPRALELLPSFVTVRSPSIGDPKSDHDAFKRGTEKKRLLLRYMRQHIEELRPATNPVEPWECQRTPKSNSARTR
jgi:hypothetical protein